jgi:hypothetical protein
MLLRSLDGDAGKLARVELVRTWEASSDLPVVAMIWPGNLKYLGQEEESLADRKWQAKKFGLSLLHAPFSTWNSHSFGSGGSFEERDGCRRNA